MVNPILEMMQNRQRNRDEQHQVSSPNNISRLSDNQSGNSILNLINMIKHSGNPNLLLQQLATQNPNVANAMNLINQSGGDPKQAFYNEAKRRGIDPNQILSLLK